MKTTTRIVNTTDEMNKLYLNWVISSNLLYKEISKILINVPNLCVI